eukprot:CAMPEP_0118716170 /NCGR_PEP_ID=MMETSP0800-20121206/27336_1 /TAXON_ID=210618 ORGANISM="Striatella unipunctata, Strain CCMP2910" /NCGR_SAMPLE_ID=MMETSP0800 /ASSEMBLY_ACC=CAM_ASM_000638 /LENGTH=434 /DNA_ID=CAMNT_0006622529 /DNA_START=157 /DNA_END=1461 /DNA_ORIENTATION=+
MKICTVSVLLSFEVIVIIINTVSGHGYMYTPRSRNWVANQDGVNGGSSADLPKREYCHHCLNTNTGVCGKSTTYNYDTYTSASGSPMAWTSQAIYKEGDTITVKTYMSTHHNGHVEVKACPDGNASDQVCFDLYPLEFVADVLYNMPADPSYPHRGYLAGGQSGGISDFEMTFKLPSGVSGDEVMLQWKYITANSCSPEGYAEYFAPNSTLPSSYWTSGLGLCTEYPADGSRGTGKPEQFWNCAEVTIENTGPTISPNPTSSPTPPAPTKIPAVARVAGCCSMNGADCDFELRECGNNKATCESSPCNYMWISGPAEEVCIAMYGQCKDYPDDCCEGLICVADPADSGNSECVPSDSAGWCCTYDYKTCEGGPWCSESYSNCMGSCGGNGWINGERDNCIPANGDCTDNTGGCCEGLSCEYGNDYWSYCKLPEM